MPPFNIPDQQRSCYGGNRQEQESYSGKGQQEEKGGSQAQGRHPFGTQDSPLRAEGPAAPVKGEGSKIVGK